MTYVKTRLKREIVIDAIITVHYFEYMKDFFFRGESHDFWEFLYVDKGTVRVLADKTWRTLNTGDIIFHRPNEFHAIRSIGKNSPNLVAVSFTSHSPAIHFFEKLTCTLEKDERVLISQIIAEARNSFSTPLHVPTVEQVMLKEDTPFASQQLILEYLELFLITVRRNHFCQPEPEPDSAAVPFEPCSAPAGNLANTELQNNSIFQDILKYMEKHVCDSLSVSVICRDFSVSRSTLQAMFHENLNCGVMDHFNRMKIDRAKEIIRNGEMNLTETAYFLSYSSPAYFSRQFRKITGMSPLMYFKSVKGISGAFKETT